MRAVKTLRTNRRTYIDPIRAKSNDVIAPTIEVYIYRERGRETLGEYNPGDYYMGGIVPHAIHMNVKMKNDFWHAHHMQANAGPDPRLLLKYGVGLLLYIYI